MTAGEGAERLFGFSALGSVLQVLGLAALARASSALAAACKHGRKQENNACVRVREKETKRHERVFQFSRSPSRTFDFLLINPVDWSF